MHNSQNGINTFSGVVTPLSPYVVMGSSRQSLRSLPTEICVTKELRICVLKVYHAPLKNESRGDGRLQSHRLENKQNVSRIFTL